MDSTARALSSSGLGSFIAHLRLPFQLALAPFFLLGLVDAGDAGGTERGAAGVILAFLAVHVGLYGGATVYNSFYDRDVGPIGMLRHPTFVTRAMRDLGVALQVVALSTLAWIDMRAGAAGMTMAALGVAYSHPALRLKARTIAGLLTVAFGQGALAVYLGRVVGSTAAPDLATLALAGAASLVAASLYPLTQVYQIDEDSSRGDVTFPVRFGWRATFVFSGVTATVGLGWLLAVLDGRLGLGIWPAPAAVAGAFLALYLWIWSRRFESLGAYGNHDRAMALAVTVALPLTALLAVVLLFWPGATARAEDAVEVSFEFRDPTSGEVLLSGRETVKQDGRVLVKRAEYRSLKGEVLQTEDCRYDRESLALESYAFVDDATGEKAAVSVKDGIASASYQKDKDATPKTDEFPWTATSLSGKAIPELVARHWDAVKAGEAVEFDLYIPFRLETLGFRAIKDQDRSTASEMVVRAEPRNWLIRQLAPAIAFTYVLDPEGKAPPRLSRYDGPSMVDIQGEKNRKIRILFR